MNSTVKNRVYLIANLRSGKGIGADVPQLAQKVCDELGLQLVTYAPTDAEQFKKQIQIAVKNAGEESGIVLAAGGDGTIRAVAEAAALADVRFGAIAIGTFNFFARTHKLSEEPEQAIRDALTGNVKAVRLGEINGHMFLINASVGLYAKSIQDREVSTKRFGRNRLVAIISTFKSMFNTHRTFDATFESGSGIVERKTPMIFIGNNYLQLSNLNFDAAECMKKDLLAVVLFKPVTRTSILRILWHGLLGKINANEDVESFCMRSMTIHTKRKSHDVALDGELFHLDTPLEVKSLPKALQLVVPLVYTHEPQKK